MTPLGAGVDGFILAAAEFDDGGGRALYVAGEFTMAGGAPASRIAKWDGAGWSPLGAGLNGMVFSLVAYDDGSGPALYAGGAFSIAGSAYAYRVARWDGSTWTAVGSSTLGGGVGGGFVYTLAVHDNGAGPALFAGGTFQTAEGRPASRLARWDGAVWSALGGGANDTVRALGVVDDGTGPALYAGGDFTQVGGGLPALRVARLVGGVFTAVRGGVDGTVLAIGAQPLAGGGSRLVIGGAFAVASGVPCRRVAAFDGNGFVEIGGGFDASVSALATFDSGAGPELFAAGSFTTSGGTSILRIARLGAADRFVGLGDRGPSATVTALASAKPFGFDRARLFVGGAFLAAGGVAAERVAAWDGTAFTAMGAGFDAAPRAFAVFDDGSGEAPYAGGSFTRSGATSVDAVARWDGAAWTGVAGGLAGGVVDDLLVFDDGSGPALYAGGEFPIGGTPSRGIVRFDGVAWTEVGGGIAGRVSALAVHDDGSGPALFAGGSFVEAAGAPASRLAKWDGLTWTALGFGVDATVRALASLDDGSGLSLFAGGEFLASGGVPIRHIVRWDGAAFHAVGNGVGGVVSSLAAYDDGTGRALYVGSTSTPSSMQLEHLVRWDGTAFTNLGTGVDGPVEAIATYADGDGIALFAGGSFSFAGGTSSHDLARWIDACAVPRTGTVDAAGGRPADVLFVNDTAGGPSRRLSLATFAPITIFVGSPPRASGQAPFALYAAAGDPDGSARRRLPFGIGTMAFPSPLRGGGGAVREIWNNTGKASLGVATRASTPAPSLIASAPNGAGRVLVVTLQGVIADPGSAGSQPASVTNAITIDVR